MFFIEYPRNQPPIAACNTSLLIRGNIDGLEILPGRLLFALGEWKTGWMNRKTDHARGSVVHRLGSTFDW